jgi:hypothetical protein
MGRKHHNGSRKRHEPSDRSATTDPSIGGASSSSSRQSPPQRASPPARQLTAPVDGAFATPPQRYDWADSPPLSQPPFSGLGGGSRQPARQDFEGMSESLAMDTLADNVTGGPVGGRRRFDQATIRSGRSLLVGPNDSVSQVGMNSNNNSSMRRRDEGESRGLRNPRYDEDDEKTLYASSGASSTKSSNYGNGGAMPDLRQRQPSIFAGNTTDSFIGGFTDGSLAAFSSAAASSISTGKEATSDAWVRRQKIKPGRVKTKRVKLTKGRFIAEYGKFYIYTKYVSC